MAFGPGVLISAVAFDLMEEAADKASGHGGAIAGIFAGCAVFFGGDWLIGRLGGGKRKDPTGGQSNGSALAIVLGSVLDGIPESMVIGLTIFQGGAVGAAPDYAEGLAELMWEGRRLTVDQIRELDQLGHELRHRFDAELDEKFRCRIRHDPVITID